MVYSQVAVDCEDCFYDVASIAVVEVEGEPPVMIPLPMDNPIVGFTRALEDELLRKFQQVGLPSKYREHQREVDATALTDETANSIVAAALVRESFGGAQEAYELGIQVDYSSSRFKMDSLHNKSSKDKMSLREWKGVTGQALASALIQEAYVWICRDRLLRSRAEGDVLELPPQLNPFTIIANQLTMSGKVMEVRRGFTTMGYSTPNLGAFDLVDPSSCARWLHYAIYPIASRFLKSHVLDSRIVAFYSYETDEKIVPRVNFIMNHGCVSYYQTIFRSLLANQVLDLPIETALDPRIGTATRIRAHLLEQLNSFPFQQPTVNQVLHHALRWTLDFMKVAGVFTEITDTNRTFRILLYWKHGSRSDR